jgi:hypothetical protein
MKKVDTILKEYFNKLSLDNLKYVSVRLNDRVGGDLGEAIEVVSNYHDIDRWLSSAKSCEDFYDMIDKLEEYSNREVNKRSPELQGAA